MNPEQQTPTPQKPSIPPPPTDPTVPVTPVANTPVNSPAQPSKPLENPDQIHPSYQTPNYGEKAEGESKNLAGVNQEFLKLFEHDANETIVYQSTRHPIGVAAIYLATLAGIATIAFCYSFLLSDSAAMKSVGINNTTTSAVGSIVAVVLIIFMGVIGYFSAYVYKKSRLILTNQKVVIIHYHSLIHREVSQLNIANVEDVNVSQPSLIDRIFKTGKVTIETAGEQNKYNLTQVQNPYEFARQTIQAHEGSIAEYGN